MRNKTLFKTEAHPACSAHSAMKVMKAMKKSKKSSAAPKKAMKAIKKDVIVVTCLAGRVARATQPTTKICTVFTRLSLQTNQQHHVFLHGGSGRARDPTHTQNMYCVYPPLFANKPTTPCVFAWRVGSRARPNPHTQNMYSFYPRRPVSK